MSFLHVFAIVILLIEIWVKRQAVPLPTPPGPLEILKQEPCGIFGPAGNLRWKITRCGSLWMSTFLWAILSMSNAKGWAGDPNFSRLVLPWFNGFYHIYKCLTVLTAIFFYFWRSGWEMLRMKKSDASPWTSSAFESASCCATSVSTCSPDPSWWLILGAESIGDVAGFDVVGQCWSSWRQEHD